MIDAFVCNLYQNRDILSGTDWSMISVGFIVACGLALFVVCYLLDYVSRNGYALFCWRHQLIDGVRLITIIIWAHDPASPSLASNIHHLSPAATSLPARRIESLRPRNRPSTAGIHMITTMAK